MKKLSSILVLIFCLIPFVASAWILRDEFNTALSAGSVHNTTSEPSGHTRTVTDTENKLSIANGALTFAGGKASPATGDPRITFPAITRAAGLGMMGETTSGSAITIGPHVGFDTDASGSPVEGFFRFNSTGATGNGYLQALLTAGAPLSVGTITGSTSYQYAGFLRGAGFYLFTKNKTQYPS